MAAMRCESKRIWCRNYINGKGTFHVSETFRNRNLSETRRNALETRFLKISVWKLSGNLRFYFGNSRFRSGNAKFFN
ncbi:hypothetical protein YC2023_093854 [Brassica napus]